MYLHFSIHRAALSKALPFALYGGGSTRTQKAAEYLSVASAFACGVEYRGSEHSRGPMSTCLASHARSGSCRFGFVGTVTHSASWPGHVKSKIRLVFTAESQLQSQHVWHQKQMGLSSLQARVGEFSPEMPGNPTQPQVARICTLGTVHLKVAGLHGP